MNLEIVNRTKYIEMDGTGALRLLSEKREKLEQYPD